MVGSSPSLAPIIHCLIVPSNSLASSVNSSVPTDNRNLTSPRFIGGVRVIQEQVLICPHLPHPEILVLDKEGRILKQFRVSTTARAVDIFGFDARASGKNIELAVGVLDPNWNSTVYELTINWPSLQQETIKIERE